MEQQSEIIIVEEEIIEEESWVRDEKEVNDEESEDIVEDELMQRPVFQIEEDHENLTEEEKEAFSYILSVRNQKKDILTFRKKNISKQPFVEDENLKEEKHTEFNSTSNQIDEIWSSISNWREETFSFWRCIIENMQYLIKLKDKQMFKERLKINCINKVPEIHRLCFNKWLQLPQIQSLLDEISSQKDESIERTKEEGRIQEEKDNYHIWIYSLLALHQSYASYTNFQALASINANIDQQYSYFLLMLSKETSEQEKNKLKQKIIAWTTTVIILIECFNQFFLKKKLFLLKAYKIL